MQVGRWLRIGLFLASVALFGACSGSAKRVGSICVSDDQCGSALCLAGTCVALTSCQTQNDCGTGVCQQGKCWEESCSADKPCPYGDCVGGYCVRLSEGVDTTTGTEDVSEDRTTSSEDAGCQTNDECAAQFPDLKICEQAVCSDGVCRRIPKLAGTSCNDDNGCTTDDKCDGTGGCVGTPAVVCADPSKPCTADTVCVSLSATTFRCNYEINKDKACDDGDACTLADSCDDKGVCQPGTTVARLGTPCGTANEVDKLCGRFGDCRQFSLTPYTFVPTEYDTTNVPDRFRLWDLCKTSDDKLFLLSHGLNDKPIDTNTERRQFVALHTVAQATIGAPDVKLTSTFTLGFEGQALETAICDGDVVIAQSAQTKALRYDAQSKSWTTVGLEKLVSAFAAVNQYGFELISMKAFYHQPGPVETFWFGGKMQNLSQFPEVEKSNVVLKCCEMGTLNQCLAGSPMTCIFEPMAPIDAQRYSDFYNWAIFDIAGDGGYPWVLKAVQSSLPSKAGPWMLDALSVPTPGSYEWVTTAPGCDGFDSSVFCYHSEGFQGDVDRNNHGWQDLTRVDIKGSKLAALVGRFDIAQVKVNSPVSTTTPNLFKGLARLHDGQQWTSLPALDDVQAFRRHATATKSFDLAQVMYAFLQARFTADGNFLVLPGLMLYCTDEGETQDCVLTPTAPAARYHIRPTLSIYDLKAKNWVVQRPIAPAHSIRCCQIDTCTDAPSCGEVTSHWAIHNQMKMQLVETSTSFRVAILYNRPNPKWSQQGAEPPFEPVFLRFDSQKP